MLLQVGVGVYYRYDTGARRNVTRSGPPLDGAGAGTAAWSLAAVPGGWGRYLVYPSSLFAVIT